MYAIMATGGKQYTVKKGDIVKVELLNNNVDDVVNFDVLYVNNDGTILTGADVQNARVEAKVLGNGKGKKVTIYKYKSKKNSRRKHGHRQPFTSVEIVDIVL